MNFNITQYAKRIDVPMIAAAVVEVPRWYVAFAAIKEPWWAAIPMGILLAGGASAGWKAYFADRSRHLLLTINVLSLLGALFVIAPVLYAMTFTPLDEIDLSQVMPSYLLMAWAATLAITTFVPLVQLAAVSMYKNAEAPTVAQSVNAESNDDADEEPAQPAQDGDTQNETSTQAERTHVAQKQRKQRKQRKPAKLTAAQRRAQVAEQNIIDPAQIVAQYTVSLRTAQEDLRSVRESMTQTNGAMGDD